MSGGNMLYIEFEYKDRYTNGKWKTQSCTMESVEKCKEWYGLGKDCEYKITTVKKIENV